MISFYSLCHNDPMQQNTNIVFSQSRKVIVGLSIFIGFWAALALIVIMGQLVPPQPGSDTTPMSTTLSVLAFFAFAIAVGLFILNTSFRTLSLQGTILTVKRRKVGSATKTIDLSKVTKIGGGVIRDYKGANYPYITFTDDSGRVVWFDLNFYTKENIARLLPAMTELVQRPGVEIGGDVNYVLKWWFGANAPQTPTTAKGQ